jgi:hypothetical protein
MDKIIEEMKPIMRDFNSLGTITKILLVLFFIKMQM